MGDIAEYVKEELINSIGIGDYQFPLFFDYPIDIGSKMHCLIEKQVSLINNFYNTIVSIAKNAINNNCSSILRILFSDYFAGLDLNYYRNLSEVFWNTPIFFRTDQSVSGKIYEIQPPGSGWGDIILISNALTKSGIILPERMSLAATNYANTIIKATKILQPKIYHMLDAASEPHSMRYLFTQTRPSLLYWGLDHNVSMDDVQFVTAHSAASLTTSNYFNIYLRLAEQGKLIFGVSPNLVFDQKAIYLLPFYRFTRDQFSDDIRNIFPFTTCLEFNSNREYGFYNCDGSYIKADDFCKLGKSKRKFFLKYGGTDLSRNWGSRAVYRLDTGSKRDCETILQKVQGLVERGELWILQEDVSHFEHSEASSDINKICILSGSKSTHIKISAFYGLDCVIGVKVMARTHYKVHGQIDTHVGIGI